MAFAPDRHRPEHTESKRPSPAEASMGRFTAAGMSDSCAIVALLSSHRSCA